MQDLSKDSLVKQIGQLPNSSGVYLFKDEEGVIVYIGKAKNLRSRVRNYVQKMESGFKESQIMRDSVCLEHIPTKTELEAMLLEAKLIQSHQPKHNVIFRQGQPFLWLMITAGNQPELVLVRNRKKKGTYFGPFIDKGSVRKVYDFLIKTFRLRLCHKKIAGGCLYYHLGLCAGACRAEFDQVAYVERLELAKQALRQGHKKFLQHLEQQIKQSNAALAFEQSRELHRYHQAFEQVFTSLQADFSLALDRARKDIWVVTPDEHSIYLFDERDSVLKKKQVFHVPYDQITSELLQEYMLGYYRQVPSAATILVNVVIAKEDLENIEAFLYEWHKDIGGSTVIHPDKDHYAALVRMATIQAEQLQKKQVSLSKVFKDFLELSFEPRSIDCFDVSHKQGTNMVGSCIRFVDGQPAPDFFRRFTIKTVFQNDDYACLRELVHRRYDNTHDFPDLILIDGGKGQLNAVQDLWPKVEFISLAKREETVFSKRFMEGKKLDITTYQGQVLIALRDYAHHFAISFHRKLAREDIG